MQLNVLLSMILSKLLANESEGRFKLTPHGHVLLTTNSSCSYDFESLSLCRIPERINTNQVRDK